MKGTRFTTIRLVFLLGIGVVVALAGCGPSSITTTPPVTPNASYLTHDFAPTVASNSAIPSDIENIPPSRPLPISIASIIRRDDDAGWQHYWATSSQQVSVNTLAYDGQWLWIVTAEGMIRLDPYNLEYELCSSTGTSPDIALDRVSTLAVDDQGRLWVAGGHGLVRYSKSAGWKAIYTDKSVTNFAFDENGNLWYLSYTARGISYAYRFRGQEPPLIGDWKPEQVEWNDAYLDPASWRLLALGSGLATGESVNASGDTWSWSHTKYLLTIYYNEQMAHQISTLYSGYGVAITQTGIWVGVKDGLFYSDGQSLKPYRFAAGKATMNHPRVDSLAFTADGSGWATTSEGLFHFREDAGKWEKMTETRMTIPLEKEEIDLIASGQQNSLWAFDWEYLAHFDGQSWERWPIPDNVFRPWAQEGSGIEYQGALWVSDTSYGLWRFDGQTWSNVDSPEITNLAQDHYGKLYAVDRNDSILVYDGAEWQPLPDCAECGKRYEFSEIAVDTTGNVWGTYESGIWRYSASEGWREILKFDTYTLVESPLTDAHEDLWFSSGGVVRCGLEKCEFWNLRDDLWGGPITALATDSHGRIWVGGYGLLSVYDPSAEP